MRTTQVTFRLGELEPELTARARDGEVGADEVRRELSRYFALLRQELAGVNLSLGECCLLADALNGSLWEPVETVELLWASVDDAIRDDHLDEKWNVDGPALVEKLRGLSFAQALSVVDAIERWWVGHAGWATFEEGFRAVGLIREPRPELRP